MNQSTNERQQFGTKKRHVATSRNKQLRIHLKRARLEARNSNSARRLRLSLGHLRNCHNCHARCVEKKKKEKVEQTSTIVTTQGVIKV